MLAHFEHSQQPPDTALLTGKNILDKGNDLCQGVIYLKVAADKLTRAIKRFK